MEKDRIHFEEQVFKAELIDLALEHFKKTDRVPSAVHFEYEDIGGPFMIRVAVSYFPKE